MDKCTFHSILHLIPGTDGSQKFIYGCKESQHPGKQGQKQPSGPILHESPGIWQEVEEGPQLAPASARLCQGCCSWRQHVGFYFLTYSTKMKTIFSSASCRASQLATENYTSCHSPLFWLEEKERERWRDRERLAGGRESVPGGSWGPACDPTMVGHLTKRAVFGSHFRMSVFMELSWVTSWFQKNPAMMGAGRSPTNTQRLHSGEKTVLATWTRASNNQG